ncbi:MAG: nucleotide exchange factor GrpE [Candidatus Gastranaerophilaceae bacterium]
MSDKKDEIQHSEVNPFNGEMDLDKVKENLEKNLNGEATTIKPEETDSEDKAETEENKSSEVAEIQAKYDTLNNQYIRLAADFDNFRKRQAQERENLLKYGAENTLKQLIEVLDNFDRGQKAIENVEDAQQIKDSFNLVLKQMNDTLTKIGLEVIETEGKEFDPNFHEAVMQTPTSEYEEGTIINELQKGYKIGDKILRAALVNVATAE